MSVVHAFQNQPIHNAIQWTGTNTAEVATFVASQQLTAFVEHGGGSLLLWDSTTNEHMIIERVYLDQWIVSAPYYSAAPDQQARYPYDIVSDDQFRLKYSTSA
ncbi:hypothetical protein [Prauserella flavalba]|uniref:hypothetical protein n=1 Tax=Prauserella flavalba TaxID=1477506 RepID=UPI0036E54CDF